MSVFNKVVLQHRCLPVNIAKFLKNSFFYRKPPVDALYVCSKGKEEESVEQKKQKIFQMKKKFDLTSACRFWC